MRRFFPLLITLLSALVARADYWMTFCAPPGDNHTYCQVGYVRPDSDGFVTLNCGGLGGTPVQTIVVYKTQVWYRQMPGNPPLSASERR